MRIKIENTYTSDLIRHYEAYFGIKGKQIKFNSGFVEKLGNNFSILKFTPNGKHQMFCYCTVGMSEDRADGNLIELFVFSPKTSESLVELLAVCASYHRNVSPLNIHHTVNIGRPWLENSKCDHGFISLPYLNGRELEVFNYKGSDVHCYWFIPITEQERTFKVEHGCEALEQLFENNQIDYLNANRASLV